MTFRNSLLIDFKGNLMPMPSRDPQRSSGEPPSEERFSESPADEETSLLAEVLRQTEQGSRDRDTADRAVWGRLLAVAERHPGEPFVLEPVLVEMVDASLEPHFGADIAPGARRVLCRRIAQTLFDDPASHERLEALWTRISARPQDR